MLSKLAGPLMKVAIPLAKNVLAPLGITAAASAIYAGIQKNTWSWNNNFNNFKRRNEWYNENYQTLEDSNILLKGVIKQFKMKQKNKKQDF